MSRQRLAALVLLPLALAGCPQSYAVNLSFEVPEAFTAEGWGDAAPEGLEIESWPPTIDYQISVYSPQDNLTRTCTDYQFGNGDLDTLAAARTYFGPLEETAAEAIPRLGEKLIVVEGTSPELGPVLRGCAAVGEIIGEVDVTITLAPLARTRSIDSARAVTPYDGPGSLGATDVTTFDAFGRPTETAVQVLLYGPTGQLARSPETLDTLIDPDALVDFDAKAELRFDDIDFVGPFVLDVTPQESLDDTLRIPGLSRPSAAAFRPFPDAEGRTIRQLLPVRFGPRDLSFVATYGLGAPDIAFATGVASDGLPVIDTFDTSVFDVLGQFSLAGQLRTQDGLEGVLVFRRANGALAFLFEDGTILPVADNTPIDRGALGMAPLGNLLPVATYPLGACRSHPLAGPYLMALAENSTAGRDETSLHVLAFDEDNNITFDLVEFEDAFPINTFCLDAPDTTVHRLVAVVTQNALAILSFGPDGVSASPDFENREYLDIPGAVALGQTEVGSPARLLSASVSAFGVDLAERKLTADGNVETEATSLYRLPLTPRALGGGLLFDPAMRHDVHLLSTGTANEEVDRPLLYIAGGTLPDGERLNTVMDLEHCLPARFCRMMLHDLDEDGRHEIYTGRANNGVGLGRSDDPDISVIRLRTSVWEPDDAIE